MNEPINLTQLRAITFPSPTHVTAIPNDTLLALIDTAEAARDLDLGACHHGLQWAESEGAADNEDVYPQIHRLRETLARYTTE